MDDNEGSSVTSVQKANAPMGALVVTVDEQYSTVEDFAAAFGRHPSAGQYAAVLGSYNDAMSKNSDYGRALNIWSQYQPTGFAQVVTGSTFSSGY